jgi:hypothetical protein
MSRPELHLIRKDLVGREKLKSAELLMVFSPSDLEPESRLKRVNYERP